MTSKTRRPTTGAKRPARHESNSEKPYVSSFDEQLRAGNPVSPAGVAHGPFALQQTPLGQQRGGGTDGRQPTAHVRRGAHQGFHPGVFAQMFHARTAAGQQDSVVPSIDGREEPVSAGSFCPRISRWAAWTFRLCCCCWRW